jgi:hypothetical protein
MSASVAPRRACCWRKAAVKSEEELGVGCRSGDRILCQRAAAFSGISSDALLMRTMGQSLIVVHSSRCVRCIMHQPTPLCGCRPSRCSPRPFRCVGCHGRRMSA